MTGRLESKRAVITGGARGIGRAIATQFSEEGARVGVLDVATDRLGETAASLPGDTLNLPCNIRDTDAVNDAIDTVVDSWGGIDILVNNAGIIVRKELVETTDEEIERTIDVNLVGALRVSRAAIPALRRHNGSIINISSIVSVEGLPDRSVYTATKGGLKSLTHQLAVELSPVVRVNAIAPGTVDTSLNKEQHENEQYLAEKLAAIPLNRLATPEDIAGPAVFLASDDARYITGHVLFVDGGRNAS